MEFLVCGLGNPGARYERTRHNVGFEVVDRVAARFGRRLRNRLFHPYRLRVVRSGADRLVLVEPLTYMNRSGTVLPGLLGKYLLDRDRLIVVCDTLDLPPGSCRMRKRGSSAGHRGLASVIESIGGSDIVRFSIGIGHPGSRELVVDYVLEPPSESERALVDSCIDRTAAAIIDLGERGVDAVMQAYNSNIDA